ncbi:MAG: hypothetical protein LBM74_10390 [Oscillospiraceae bacterium]|jgi:hypothetical protein|nr:hypothetical protein [Oscillospiraceae bacterium]
MAKWRLLVVLMLVLGLMGSMATAEEVDLPVVVVDLPQLEDMQPLFAEASESAAVLGEYARGTNAWLLGEEAGFNRIRLGDGTEGYMPSDKILDMTPFTGLVTPALVRQRQFWGNSLNIRLFRLYEYPLEGAPYITLRPVRGQSLTVLEQFGAWMHLRTEDGQEGYIPTVELDVTIALPEDPEIAAPDCLYVVPEDTRVLTPLYAQPDANSELLGEYYAGTHMERLPYEIDPEDQAAWDWMYVRIGELEGYVPENFTNMYYIEEAAMWGNG